MYERSAIVLETYFEEVLGFNKGNNLKTNYENYNRLIEKIKEYQRIIKEEENVIGKFDEVASEIEEIQKRQNKLHEANLKLEEERNNLFNDLSENPSILDQKLQKIEESFDLNNDELKGLREKYVKALVIFTERQKERNKYSRAHRTAEAEYLDTVKEITSEFSETNIKEIENVKRFINSEDEQEKNDVIDKMLKNGRNERVPFNNEVIKKAVEVRTDIAKKEAELYISVFEKMKRLLGEVNSGAVKLTKFEKTQRDVSVKLAFLTAEKEYIVGFLDNERMTAMNGKQVHNKLMEEACQNFDLDIRQINNLYELVIRETTKKATKKAYKELYNKTYLKDIEEKERDFEEEVTNIKINMGTVINSNYWRIEGIKNIYNVFQEEISEKFEKDLSEYRIEEAEENKTTLTDKEDDKEDIYSGDEYNDNEDYEDDDYEDVEFDEDENDYDDNYNENYDDEDEDYNDEYEDEDDNDYEDVEFDEDDYDDDDDYDDEDEGIIEDDGEITEEKIDQIIKESRKGKNKKKDKQEKGLFGRLFKK